MSMELGYLIGIRRKTRADGGVTLAIRVSPRAPSGAYGDPIKITCDFGSVPYLAEALQVAIEFPLEKLDVQGDDDDDE